MPVVRNQTRGALWGGKWGERGREGFEDRAVLVGGVMVEQERRRWTSFGGGLPGPLIHQMSGDGVVVLKN